MRFSKCLLVIAGVCLAAPAAAGESPFGYVYTTDTHPKGKREVEQWITRRHGQAKGDYDLWQARTEIEYGLTDRLQTALYLNYDRVNAFRNRPDDTTGPGAFVPDGVDPDARYRRSFAESVSSEWIYRLLSPYKDPIGLALYVEPSWGPDKRELEGKLILQKNFLDDRLVWAANLTAAAEKERFHGEWEHEGELELTSGVAYQFLPRWHAGLEYRHHRGYAGRGFSAEKRVYAAKFLGPTVHYASRDWWVTATFLKQLANAKAYTDAAGEDVIGGRFYGEHHERNELRVRFGLSF
ncbi:MAG TPA: DUF6662 family protein [Burkholderiales bacterium]